MATCAIKVWLSYDLGVRGDYEGLYRWLDDREAQECGNSVAVFSYPYDANFPNSLIEDLQENVEFPKGSRIYISYRDPESKSMKGKFLLGSRKMPPWAGYGSSVAESLDLEL